MSYTDGMAAINLEMPKRIPRTEYSAHTHWKLIKAVTGIEVDHESDTQTKKNASKSFMKAWNYDFLWSILIQRKVFGEYITKMGHAAYADGDVDFDTNVYCPFNDTADVLSFDPFEAFGKRDQNELIKAFEADYTNKVEAFPDVVNMTGIYVTCMSGLIDIFGWDMLLMAAAEDPKGFGQTANRYSDWIKQYFEALGKSNVPVVMIHDDIVWTQGAFLHPDWYREFIFPNYKRCFAPLIESGKKIMYTSDGCYNQFIDDIAGCQVNGFVMEPATDMSYIAEKYGSSHVIIGNADTRILLKGSKEDIYNEVKRCIDTGKKCPGYFMAVGNHIPANTPVENAIYYNEVYEKLARR